MEESWKNFIYNQPNILGIMKSGRLELAGHIVRKKDERSPRMMIEMVPKGRNPVDGPRRRWMDVL